MKIQVLCEDSASDVGFTPEHGLSLLIQTHTHTILFDAGQSDLFLQNAMQLRSPIDAIDVIVLSHGHYDHGNGLRAILERNPHAKVYLRAEAFGAFYHGSRYIGLSEQIRAYSDRFVMLEGDQPFSIDEQLTILPARALPLPPASDFTANGQTDLFDHEQYLLIRQDRFCACLTGCSHRGIRAIASYAKEYGATHLVGGFHLPDETEPDTCRSIAEHLRLLGLDCYTGHCTGMQSYAYLAEILQEKLHKLSAGTQFVIGDHAERASFLFRCGYNCSQSVFGAFAEELGLDFTTAMRLSCSFGGGMGRLRETCGAVSGMLLVCGMCNGYQTPETGAIKADHYRVVQDLVNTFRKRNGAIICRELLGGSASTSPVPTARTEEFYRTRPCERCITSAAAIAEEKLFPGK